MLLGLALNHGVILDFKGAYLASSPDELSLLNAAKFMGVTMLARDLEKIQIEVKGQTRTYEILFVIEFTSTRKRMTTVLRSPQGQILVFCKGADTVLLPLTSSSADQSHTRVKAQTLKFLDEYARQGLRTLLFCMKYMTEEEFSQFKSDYQAASILHGK